MKMNKFWTPVAKELPKNDMDVWVAVKIEDVMAYNKVHYFNGFNCYKNSSKKYELKEVVAWAYIPEYREELDNE